MNPPGERTPFPAHFPSENNGDDGERPSTANTGINGDDAARSSPRESSTVADEVNNSGGESVSGTNKLPKEGLRNSANRLAGKTSSVPSTTSVGTSSTFQRGLGRTAEEWAAKASARQSKTNPSPGAAVQRKGRSELSRGLRRTAEEWAAKNRAREEGKEEDVEIQAEALETPPLQAEPVNARSQANDAKTILSTPSKISRHLSNSQLVEALPVEEGSSRALLQEAQQVDNSQLELRAQEEKQRQKCRKIECVIAFIALAILAISLGVGLRPKEIPPAANPTEEPTPISTSMEEAIKLLLPDYSLKAMEEDSTSPQHLAFQFMLDDPDLMEYPNWRVQQRFALATFYFATGGDSWKDNSGWLDYSKHECKWFGRPPALYLFTNVGEDAEDILEIYSVLSNYANPCEEEDPKNISLGKYHHISQAANDLTGTLPPQISLLTSLKTINLDLASPVDGDGGLKGSIPAEIGSLSDLEVLALMLNHFTGTLPSTMQELSSLRHLGLGGSELTGEIPTWIGIITSLNLEIGLFWNRLNGTIPSQLGKLTDLGAISFDDNQLVGTIPSEVWTLTSLERLYLQSNQLSGKIPTQIGLLSNIQSRGGYQDVVLTENLLSGSIPSEAGMVNATWFGLGSNQLTGAIPTQIGQLSIVQWLDLARNELTGAIFTQIGQLASVIWLALNDNQLTGTISRDGIIGG